MGKAEGGWGTGGVPIRTVGGPGDYQMKRYQMKRPHAVSTVVAFRNKKMNIVKETAIEIVTKMYRICCEDNKEMKIGCLRFELTCVNFLK